MDRAPQGFHAPTKNMFTTRVSEINIPLDVFPISSLSDRVGLRGLEPLVISLKVTW